MIIITSKEQYAIEAFDYDVTAYLLKPVTDYARFLKAVLKVREKLEASWQKPAENIFVRADSLLTNLALSDILRIEAFGDYVKINTDKKVFTVYSTMKAVEEKLPSETFMRVHRSFLINVPKDRQYRSGKFADRRQDHSGGQLVSRRPYEAHQYALSQYVRSFYCVLFTVSVRAPAYRPRPPGCYALPDPRIALARGTCRGFFCGCSSRRPLSRYSLI